MDDYYYLEANYHIENGRKKLDNYDLFNGSELIKSYTHEESRIINKKAKAEDKENKIIKRRRNKIYIDNLYFINNIEKELNPPKRNKTNKKLLAVFLGFSILTLLGTVKVNNKNNTTSTPVVEDEEINDDEKEEKNEEIVTINDINATLLVENTKPTKKNVVVENKEENELVDNGFESIFEFEYEDRSDSDNITLVNNNYSYSIDVYSKRYGLDPKLMTAIICQENPTNIPNYNIIAGHGVTEIEGIHNGSEIVTFNYETNQNESSGPIDVFKCVEDQDYSIKIGCMIMGYSYNEIHENYSYKLTKEQELAASVWAYNKGITIIKEALDNTNTFDEFKYYVYEKSIGGDNEYIEHVFSYIGDQEIITMKTRDGLLNSVMIDNTTVDNNKKTVVL